MHLRRFALELRTLATLFLLAGCFAAIAPARAAASYGAGSGLPNLSVTAIARGQDGLIWLGTEDGLVRFDGHRFIEVSLEHAQQRAERYVSALLATPEGMYIATRRALLFHRAHSDTLEAVRIEGADLADVVGLGLGAEGWRHAATSDGQLWRWSGQAHGSLTALLPVGSADQPHAFTGMHIGASAIWLAARDGVYRFDAQDSILTELHLSAPELDNGRREARAVIEFPQGTLWIGYWNDGLVRVDLATGAHHWYHPGDAASAALRSTSIYAFATQSDRLYIGSNRGLVVYRRDCDCLRALNLPSWDALDGSGIIAQSLLAESDGVWAGVFGEGVVRFGRDDEAFHNQVRVNARNDRLAHSQVRALHLGRDRRLWIGTYGGGVQWLAASDRLTGLPWTLQLLDWDVPRIEARYLWSIEQTTAGLLLGTGAGLFEQRGTGIAAIDASVERIRCTLQVRDGRRYVGTQRGLYRVEREQLVRIEFAPNGADAMVWSLAEHGNELWVGTTAGLARLDPSDQLIESHSIGPNANELPGAVFAQRRAPDGRHWLGTAGGLVVAEDNSGIKFVQPLSLEHARVRNVTSIEFDRSGRFWLGTSQGLVRYIPANEGIRRYTQAHGLFGNQFNSGASANDVDRLIFGGMGGLVSFDPDELDAPRAQLQPRLTRLRVGQGAFVQSGILELPANHDALQLQFSAGEFLHPQSVRYALNWRGLVTSATELGDASSAVVERLPAGTHTLELQASRIDEPGSARTAIVLEVHVAYAWHETWLGRTALALLGLVGVIHVIQWRTRATRLQRAHLELQVGARTRELNAATDALRTSNQQLQAIALTDPLTGLANRRRLFQQAQEWSEQGQRLSVMMIDLDRFKDCNDRYGHAQGDRVLQEFSQLLRDTSIERKLCVRYGGEEFLLLATDSGKAALEHAALALLQTVRSHRIVFDSGQVFGFTISVGLARAAIGEPIETTIRRADVALYHAKRSRDAHYWAGD